MLELLFLYPWRHKRRLGAAVFGLIMVGVLTYVPYGFETRGRFQAVAAGMERQLATARGGADPTDDEVHDTILRIAREQQVELDDLTVRHELVSETSGGERVAGERLLLYSVTARARTTYMGVEASAPLRGAIEVRSPMWGASTAER